MPARNIVKTYVTDGVYHIYNRGVEKRKIFLDEEDYIVFLALLKKYLSSKIKILDTINNKIIEKDNNKSMNLEISVFCFCLMPNHFHLLVKQADKQKSIAVFMQKICTSYSIYFNKKYDRVGKLFQGHYKAVLVREDYYLLHLSRYIHRNPFELFHSDKNMLAKYNWSSYADYLELKNTKWVNKSLILKFFDNSVYKTSYRSFVEDYEIEEIEDLSKVQKLDYEAEI